MEHTFCPSCGFEIPVDEDGCCKICGCDAVGEGVDMVVRLQIERDELRAELALYKPLAELILESYVLNARLSQTIDSGEWLVNRQQHRKLRDQMYQLCKQIKGE